MKGKKLLALLLAAVLAAGVLTACGGPGTSAGVKLNTGTIEADAGDGRGDCRRRSGW